MSMDLRPVRKILLATGLTTESVGAVVMAQRLAGLFGAELHAVHVVEPVSAEAEAAIPGLAEKHLTQAEEEVGHFTATHGLDKDSTIHVLRGSPEEEVLGLRKQLDADLLVVGRYGKGGLKHDQLGSIADRLVRHCQVPTLVIQPEFRGSYQRIGVASDLDDEQPVELRRALDLAKLFGADRIDLITAWEVPHGYHTVLTYEEAAQKLEAITRERAEALIARARREDDAEVRVVTRLGSPRAAVPDAAREEGIELLVMSTHYRTNKAAAILLGRTTERILAKVYCSVWAETAPELRQTFLEALRHLFD